MDYSVYRLTRREQLKILGLSVVATLLVAKLFYDSYLLLLSYPIFLYFLWKREKEAGKKRRQAALSMEFLDALRVVNTSLYAGLSIENAWMEAKREVEVLHGEKSMMARELAALAKQLALSKSVEEWLLDFAARSGVENIANFADVFSYAKRSGGNLSAIVDQTTSQMRQKQDTEKEIAVMVAKRKLEQQVMELIPMMILAYLRLSSGDYMDSLYGNPLGIVIMTACLFCYGLSVFLADKILAIEV